MERDLSLGGVSGEVRGGVSKTKCHGESFRMM
jgi:hypothetical protein